MKTIPAKIIKKKILKEHYNAENNFSNNDEKEHIEAKEHFNAENKMNNNEIIQTISFELNQKQINCFKPIKDFKKTNI